VNSRTRFIEHVNTLVFTFCRHHV